MLNINLKPTLSGAAALANDTRKEQEKAKSKQNASSQNHDHAARRDAKRAAERAEKDVTAAEEKVAEIRRELENPALYDGTGANAKRAGQLDKQLTDALKQLDTAIARWAALEE